MTRKTFNVREVVEAYAARVVEYRKDVAALRRELEHVAQLRQKVTHETRVEQVPSAAYDRMISEIQRRVADLERRVQAHRWWWQRR